MAPKYNLSLRQRKHAQTKIALAQAAETRMRERTLNDISVKELCETVPVSEVTFYNYFPQKTDLLLYIVQLWHLEARWHVQKWEKEKTNLELIEAFFDFAGQRFEEFPLMMNEVLIFFIQRRGACVFEEMSVAEKVLAFPELEGIEDIEIPKNLKEEGMLLPYIAEAISSGELPPGTDYEQVSHMFDTILTGGLMTLHEKAPAQIRPLYHRMLKFFWQGLWTEAEAEENTKNIHLAKMA